MAKFNYHSEHNPLEPPEYLILKDKGLIYLNISKAGCTSIKTLIARSYSVSFDETITSIHSTDFQKKNVVFGELQEEQKRYFKFTFVRNPFSRLASCYRERIILGSIYYPSATGYFQDTYIYYKQYPLAMGMPFEDFVMMIAKIPDSLADRHFKSQSSTIYDLNGRKRVDFIGKIEEAARDWPLIAKRFGFDTVLAQLNTTYSTKEHPKKKWDYRSLYTPFLLDKVYHRYKQDIELFGYEAEYQILKQWCKEK